jgi:hypothetical protein
MKLLGLVRFLSGFVFCGAVGGLGAFALIRPIDKGDWTALGMGIGVGIGVAVGQIFWICDYLLRREPRQ